MVEDRNIAGAWRDLTHRALEHRRAELERLMELVPQPSPLTLATVGGTVGEPDWPRSLILGRFDRALGT